MPDAPPAELRAAIAEGRALIVCGAGVSRAATDGKAPGWEPLIRDALAEAATLGGGMTQPWAKACEALLASAEVADWLGAANIIQQKLAPVDGPYRAFFVSRLGALKAAQPGILEAIAKIASARNKIATTNYDHLISEAIGWDRADWTDHQRVVEALRGKRPAVWHIHGDFDRPRSIILSQNDYDRIAESELPQFVQRSAGLAFTLVFVGCSGSGLSDDNVGRLLTWMRAGFAGLGDRHFVLVADSNTDSWPNGVTPVRFGAHPELSAYLAALAPDPVLRSALPRNPKMIGREDRLKELVKAILEEDRPIVVPGALGIGKSTLALAAAHDRRIVARFGKDRRFFINLEPAPDAEALLGRLASHLGLPASGAGFEVEAKIAAACDAKPALAILDNLETPLRKDPAGTEALLGRLASIDGLRLVVTVRGEPPKLPAPGARTLRDVERLGEADSRSLFLRHAGDQFAADPALPGLIAALDGHPLSIELLAANAQGKSDLKGVAADWSDRRADLLGRGGANDRRTSLRASLDLSLAALDPPSLPHRLIRLMALLPDGISETDSRAILSDGAPTKDERGAASRLETARLASRASGRWRLLAPVRETLLADFPPEPEDQARLTNLFLRRASLGQHAGTGKWDDVRDELTAEAGNLDAMIAVAARAPELSKQVNGIRELHRFTGLASCASLPAVAQRFHNVGDLLAEANCIFGLGLIALARSDYDGARRRYETALPLFLEVGSVRGAANCISKLGDAAYARSDHKGARQRYEEALQLYRKIGDERGEANCTSSLGEIARELSDHDGARRSYEAALPLYRKIGDPLGEANCIYAFGEVARECLGYGEARQRYEAALPLFHKVGSVVGKADCLRGFGDIALAEGDLDQASDRYTSALPLCQQVGNTFGEASCLQGFGDIEEARGAFAAACARWREALALYAKIPEPKSIGLAHIRLARRAATPQEAAEHRDAARGAWESISRPDLIERHLGKDA